MLISSVELIDTIKSYNKFRIIQEKYRRVSVCMTQAEDRTLEEKRIIIIAEKITINMISILDENIKWSELLKRGK